MSLDLYTSYYHLPAPMSSQIISALAHKGQGIRIVKSAEKLAIEGTERTGQLVKKLQMRITY